MKPFPSNLPPACAAYFLVFACKVIVDASFDGEGAVSQISGIYNLNGSKFNASEDSAMLDDVHEELNRGKYSESFDLDLL